MPITMMMMDLVKILNQDNPNPSSNWNDKIKYANNKIFSFDYPFYDNDKKEEFQLKFTRRFIDARLGFETPALFMLKLEDTLNYIMPYYNEYFKSQLMDYDPLTNMEIEEIFDRSNDINRNKNITENDNGTRNIERTGNNSGTDTLTKSGTETTDKNDTMNDNIKHTGTVSTDGSSTDTYYEFPQAAKSTSGDYATNQRNISSDETVTNDLTDTENKTSTGEETVTYNLTDKRDTTETIGDNTDETTTNTRTTEDNGLEKQLEHYVSTKKGLTGQWTYQDLIRKYRELIINVDAMIMESVEIKSLFIYCE